MTDCVTCPLRARGVDYRELYAKAAKERDELKAELSKLKAPKLPESEIEWIREN